MLPVLIIEDDEQLLRLLCLFFMEEGREVLCSTTAEEGIYLARSLRPAVIVCDLLLPAASGLWVAAAVKSNPELADTRLIAMTGQSGLGLEQEALEAGFDMLIAKPLKIEALVEQVRRIERKVGAMMEDGGGG